MTITSNIHIGLSAWASGVAYTTGNRVKNASKAYEAISSGTSGATAPTGTATDNFDGGVHWKYLSAISYETLAAWEASIPSTLTDHIVGLLWNNAAITTTVGVPFLTIGTFGAPRSVGSYTITLKCATGESFRDKLKNTGNALVYNASNGVSFVLPSSGVGGINYIDVYDPNVIFDGLQFKDPNSASGSTLVNSNSGTSTTIINCIVDGYAQPGGAWLITSSSTLKIANCLIVDRQATASQAFAVEAAGASSWVINSTFYGVNTPSVSACGYLVNDAAARVINCIFSGYPVPVGGTSNLVQVSYCVLSSANVGNATDSGNNKFSKNAVNQFVSVVSVAFDFRLKTGSDAHHAGTTDLTRLPSAVDILNYARPQGLSTAAWSIGASEFAGEITSRTSIGTVGASGSLAGTNPASLNRAIVIGVSITAIQASGITLNKSIGAIRLDSAMVQENRISALTRSIGAIGLTSNAVQENRLSTNVSVGSILALSDPTNFASATVSIRPIGRSISATQERFLSATASVGSIGSSGSISSTIVSASSPIGTIAASANLNQFNLAVGSARLLPAASGSATGDNVLSAAVSIGMIRMPPQLFVSQSPFEILTSGGFLRVSQLSAQVLHSRGRIRVSQSAAEVLHASPPISSAHVSQVIAEVFVSGTAKARVTQSLREVLTGGSGNQNIRVSQIAREILTSIPLGSPVRVSQIAMEILVPAIVLDHQSCTFIV